MVDAADNAAPGDLDTQIQPTPPAEPAPTVTEVDVGGKKFTVDAGLAEALARDQQKTKIQLDETNKFIKQMRDAQPKATEPAPAAAPTVTADMLFTDTEKWMEEFRSGIKTELSQEYNAARTKERSQADFWDNYWTTNDDLSSKKHKLVTESVMQRDYNELVNLTVGEQYTELGERVRKELLNLGVQKDAGAPSKRVVVEGANTPTPEPGVTEPAKGDESRVTSISDIIKRKAEDRRNAIVNRKSA